MLVRYVLLGIATGFAAFHSFYWIAALESVEINSIVGGAFGLVLYLLPRKDIARFLVLPLWCALALTFTLKMLVMKLNLIQINLSDWGPIAALTGIAQGIFFAWRANQHMPKRSEALFPRT